MDITNPFRVDKKTMTIGVKTSSFILSLPEATKRNRVLDSKQKWVDTEPIHLMCSLTASGESISLLVQTLWEKKHPTSEVESEETESQKEESSEKKKDSHTNGNKTKNHNSEKNQGKPTVVIYFRYKKPPD